MSTDTLEPANSSAWTALAAHAATLRKLSVAGLLQQPERSEASMVEHAGLLADFPRTLTTPETLRLLEELAVERGVAGQLSSMLAGDKINNTEGRAALHMALRGTATSLSGVAEAVDQELEAFLGFADAVREGSVVGSSGQRFRTVINIGIGGSDLGPRLVARALASKDDPIEVRFVAGVDGIELADALHDADPASTLFIVCSKTFTTLETRVNADAALAWLGTAGADFRSRDHFAAVSTNSAAMDEFGIRNEWRFQIWDWVGGRYSVWSAIGLSAAIAIGSQAFREVLAGAKAMDEHLLSAPFAENIPLLLAMLGIWEQNFLGKNALVVLPYDQRLEDLPDYLQQLYMESQGKGVTTAGQPVPVSTGVAVWGAPGSHAQHSFAQWLHQGSAEVVVEYVGVVNGPARTAISSQMLAVANMLAQADALAFGQRADQVSEALRAAGVSEADALIPHKVHPGNRSSVVLLMRELSPAGLGALLAHYEHRVFVQAMIWGINPFDQWGVELGKQHARHYARELEAGNLSKLPALGKRILQWADRSKG